MNKEQMPVIQITPPEVKVVQKNNITVNEYNYDNSHLIYKLFDVGSFKEIVNMKKENQQLKEELNACMIERNKLVDVIEEAINHLDCFISDTNLSKYDTLKILMYTKKVLQKYKGDNNE